MENRINHQNDFICFISDDDDDDDDDDDYDDGDDDEKPDTINDQL